MTVILSIPFLLIGIIMIVAAFADTNENAKRYAPEATDDLVLFCRVGLFLGSFVPFAISYGLFTY